MSIVPGSHDQDEPVWGDEDESSAAASNSHSIQPLSLVHGDADAKTVWILIGAHQAEAAASCDPDDVAVYCLDERSVVNPPENLDVTEDKTVLIFPLGDAATEARVFDDATNLGRWCEEEGAAVVRFVWLGSHLDDHLGKRALADRKKRLERLVGKRIGAKPAKAKPKGPSQFQQNVQSTLGALEAEALEEGRPVVDVNGDRLVVLNKLVRAMQEGSDSERLFDLGGKIACTTTDENDATIAELVDDELLLNLLARCSKMVSVTERAVSPSWPETKTVTALFGRNRDFRPLRGIAPSPIVRADNTIADTDGYDEASQVLLDLAGLEMKIPNAPTKDEVAQAVTLLMDEWLGDFPFATEADKANCLALILTYPLRELVSLVPLAVISAKSKGTGKSKLLGLIVLLFTRAMPDWDSLPGSEEETRKQITTLLLAATAFLGFDESPEIGGKSINRLLTAHTWSDRRLGVSERVALPNRAVMAATGNNVQIIGDTVRRYYPIELFYNGENPEDRPESDFRHPDIEAWTLEHRGKLLTAVFTLIRAWQVAGRPKKTTSFGSFERWEAIIGGVIENAGVRGFLTNLAEHRKSADFDEGLWVAFCAWLSDEFPDGDFTTSAAVSKMLVPIGKNQHVLNYRVPLPPGIKGSPTDSEYPANLGRLLHKRHGGWSHGYRITKTDNKTDNKTVWSIEVAPRILQEKADAVDRQKAQQARAEGEQARRNLPRLEAALADLEAKGAEPNKLKLARLEVENARLLADQVGREE